MESILYVMWMVLALWKLQANTMMIVQKYLGKLWLLHLIIYFVNNENFFTCNLEKFRRNSKEYQFAVMCVKRIYLYGLSLNIFSDSFFFNPFWLKYLPYLFLVHLFLIILIYLMVLGLDISMGQNPLKFSLFC